MDMEWLKTNWPTVLVALGSIGALVLSIINSLSQRKQRRKDDLQELQDSIDDVDEKVVALGREISEIQGHLGIRRKTPS